MLIVMFTLGFLLHASSSFAANDSKVTSLCDVVVKRNNADLDQNPEAPAILRGMLSIDPDAELTVLTDPPQLVRARTDEDFIKALGEELRAVPRGSYLYVTSPILDTEFLARLRAGFTYYGLKSRFVYVQPLHRRGLLVQTALDPDAPTPF